MGGGNRRKKVSSSSVSCVHDLSSCSSTPSALAHYFILSFADVLKLKGRCVLRKLPSLAACPVAASRLSNQICL